MLLAGAIAVWQVYYGISNVILFLNAGGGDISTSARVIMWLLALRTFILLLLLLCCCFLRIARDLATASGL